MLLSWSRNSPGSWNPKLHCQFNPITQYFGRDSCAPSEYKPLAPTDCLRAPYHALCLFGLSATFRIARKSYTPRNSCQQTQLGRWPIRSVRTEQLPFFARGVEICRSVLHTVPTSYPFPAIVRASEDRFAFFWLETGRKITQLPLTSPVAYTTSHRGTDVVFT